MTRVPDIYEEFSESVREKLLDLFSEIGAVIGIVGRTDSLPELREAILAVAGDAFDEVVWIRAVTDTVYEAAMERARLRSERVKALRQ